MSMRFKKTSRNMDFADLAMANCLEQNRSIKLMDQLSNTINWSRVESPSCSATTPWAPARKAPAPTRP